MPTDINKTTRFEYNLDGNLVKLIAENATTGDQVTEWIYGVTVGQGSKMESKALVYRKVYPHDPESDPDPSDVVTYQYNRMGQVIGMVDQAGTKHEYVFDQFGRVLEDAVTEFGTGVDETVQKITRSYEVRGMLEKVTSWGLDGTEPVILNEVQLSYNDYSQLVSDAQEHEGEVDELTLRVGYSYEEVLANTVRRTGIIYPDDTTITTAYEGEAAAALSRPDALKEGIETLCSYRYLGAGVFIGVKFDAASDVELTYENGGSGDAGDKYTGLDRFGRLIETIWKTVSSVRVKSKYGRNRFSGVVWRKDEEAHAQSVDTEDNFYWYDGLYQVSEHKRGELDGDPPDGITDLQQNEEWTYDETGNWSEYSSTSPANEQSRTHNWVNEITEIADGTSTIDDVNPTYDAAGNMLTMPKDPGLETSMYKLKWDAWNRLVAVTNEDDSAVASYTYDGLTRRQTKTDEEAEETRHYYYNSQWRAVEERVEGAVIPVDRQYTWGLRDRWDLLRRKRTTTESLDEVHYCLRDYLDPVAIIGTDGEVKERYAYDAFGNVRFLAPDYDSRSTSDFDWEFLFHGEFRDAETGLYNYGYRYYDASLGRWLSRDPIGESGGINLNEFVKNAPSTYLDLIGEKPVLEAILDDDPKRNRAGLCGGWLGTIKWKVTGAESGMIIQLVTTEHKIESCPNVVPSWTTRRKSELLEAWNWPLWDKTLALGDTWGNQSAAEFVGGQPRVKPCKGAWKVKASAVFLSKKTNLNGLLTKNDKYYGIFAQGHLAAEYMTTEFAWTWNEDKGRYEGESPYKLPKGDSNVVTRELCIKWDCCNGPQKSVKC